MHKPKHKQGSLITETLAKKQKTDTSTNQNFNVSFQYLDTTQKFGSGFAHWQKVGLLSKALEVLQGYCCSPLHQSIDGDKFTKYGEFPPKEKTMFKMPSSISEDVCWARIHVTGAAVLAGYIVNNTFYVVFLDGTHKFYLTKKVTGN